MFIIVLYISLKMKKAIVIIVNEKATLLAIKYNYQNLLDTNANTHTMNTTYVDL